MQQSLLPEHALVPKAVGGLREGQVRQKEEKEEERWQEEMISFIISSLNLPKHSHCLMIKVYYIRYNSYMGYNSHCDYQNCTYKCCNYNGDCP